LVFGQKLEPGLDLEVKLVLPEHIQSLAVLSQSRKPAAVNIRRVLSSSSSSSSSSHAVLERT
jgi:hypothetical protein